VIVNVEEWDPKETMPRTVLTPPAGGSPMPDIPNWAWHEYGNRVGFWRMLEVFDRHEIPAALAINGKAIATYEPIARAAKERDWEFIGHGFGQKNMQKGAGRARGHPQDQGRDPCLHGPRSARLARTGTDGNLGDAGHPGRGRLRLCLRLGAGRRAGRAEDAHEADRERARTRRNATTSP
jgi:hypothetical protein